ncbi:MAG: PAS domain S-box protein [Candidatus Pacebacteria bacterium]|nr:PAS domain S-box protein [Candidatus Paceibacterota bacterium]
MNILFLDEHRCKCGKLLLKGIFFDGTLEIKCKRCGEINKIGNIKLVDDATHYLLVTNRDGTIVNGSEAACYILGYSRSELIGKHFTQINPTMPKEIGEKFFGPESVLNENNYFQIDTFHQSKSGKKIPVTVFLKLYQPAVKEKYLLVIAEPKNIESKKNFLKKDVPEFLDCACDFYFNIDENGVVECISPSVKKLFGFCEETIIGKDYFSIAPPETADERRKVFGYFSVNGQPYRVSHDIGIDGDGKIVHNELYFTPQFDDGGKFSGYRVLGWVINPETQQFII